MKTIDYGDLIQSLYYLRYMYVDPIGLVIIKSVIKKKFIGLNYKIIFLKLLFEAKTKLIVTKTKLIAKETK